MRNHPVLPDGKVTERVYQLLKNQRYSEAAGVIQGLLQCQQKVGEEMQACKPLFELLGYCLYMMRDFEGSAQVYSQLQEAFPDTIEYEVRNCLD